MRKSYKTVFEEAYFSFDEKRSRFITRVKPVSLEDEAIGFINEIKTKSWDASHNCYAYYIEGESVYQRYSDDGEPQGTAGLPILDVIRRQHLVNVVIVVTRYFGGILLGAGGLVRAYGKAAAGGINESRVISVRACTEIKIRIEYHLSGKLQNLLLNDQILIHDIDYAELVTFTVLVDDDQKEAFHEKINDLTGGKPDITIVGLKSVKHDELGNVLQVG